MFTKILVAEIKGISFRVTNNWFGGMKIYQNNNLIAHNKRVFAFYKNEPVFSRIITIDETEKLVEIYAYAIFRVKIQIKIDGVKIAGAAF
jgi:hypothetical protein